MLSRVKYFLQCIVWTISWDEASIPGPILVECGPRWLVDGLHQRALRKAREIDRPEIMAIRLSRVYSAMAHVAEKRQKISEAIMLHEKSIATGAPESWFNHFVIGELHASRVITRLRSGI